MVANVFKTLSEHFTVYQNRIVDNDMESLQAVFLDSAHHQLAIFHVRALDIIDYTADKTVTVIRDTQHDQMEIHKMEYIIGTRLPSCEIVYVITHHDCIVGQITLNKLTNKLELMCKDSYSWRMYVCPDVRSQSQSVCQNLNIEELTFLKETCGLKVNIDENGCVHDDDPEMEMAPITCYRSQRLVSIEAQQRSYSGPI